MTRSFSYSQATPSPTPSSVATIYIHPTDVTNDTTLTIAEKRAILASWISDARAVEDAPLCVGSIVAQSFLLTRSARPWFRSMNRCWEAERRRVIGFYTSTAGVAWSQSG